MVNNLKKFKGSIIEKTLSNVKGKKSKNYGKAPCLGIKNNKLKNNVRR